MKESIGVRVGGNRREPVSAVDDEKVEGCAGQEAEKVEGQFGMPRAGEHRDGPAAHLGVGKPAVEGLDDLQVQVAHLPELDQGPEIAVDHAELARGQAGEGAVELGRVGRGELPLLRLGRHQPLLDRPAVEAPHHLDVPRVVQGAAGHGLVEGCQAKAAADDDRLQGTEEENAVPRPRRVRRRDEAAPQLLELVPIPARGGLGNAVALEDVAVDPEHLHVDVAGKAVLPPVDEEIALDRRISLIHPETAALRGGGEIGEHPRLLEKLQKRHVHQVAPQPPRCPGSGAWAARSRCSTSRWRDRSATRRAAAPALPATS